MNKKVIFWGCGKIAGEMYNKYKDEITLLYGISNNPNETLFVPEAGCEFPVKRPENKVKNEAGMVIICSADYERIAEQLSLLGYIPFVDFMDYELADILWSGKQIVLLYGFCHLRGIADCLKSAKAFLNTYVPIYYPDYLFLNFYQQARFQYIVSRCSVFVYGMAILPENGRKNAAILGGLKPDVKVLRLHAAYFGGYFPQKKRAYNNMNDFAVKIEGLDYTPFSYGDSFLNECIDAGMSVDDIFSYIENEEIYERDFILKYVEREWKRLSRQEQESDFRIMDFIKINYRARRLFRNETHMENVVLYQYALQLLQYLGYNEEIPAKDAPLMNCSQHFIYPCVARALELEWDVWQEKLDLYTYAGWKSVNMREYIQTYYESCNMIRQLKIKHLI